MRSWIVIPLGLMLASCKDGDDSDTNIDPGDITGTPGDISDYEQSWDISGDEPDCEALELDGCAEPVVLEGATRFYLGELVWDEDGGVSGYESKVLFANEAWKETNDATDCQVVWNLIGNKTDGAGAYTYTFTLVANIDRTRSDCPADYISAEDPSYELVYHVAVAANGDATVFFESGTTFANGIATDNGLGYVDGGLCEWYGSGECT